MSHTVRANLFNLEKNEAEGIIYCGAHYSRCPVEVRELWAQGYALSEGPAALKTIVDDLMAEQGTEVVVISTCNRFDLCLFGRLNPSKIEEIFIRFIDWTSTRIPNMNSSLLQAKNWQQDIPSWIRTQNGEQALLQLFRVASSLDSLVLGEPHILGQLKESYQSAVAHGLCSQEATATFNRTFQVAKKVRSETELGKNAVSIGHAAVEIIQRVFENLSKQRCLILGAGEMARVTSQHLRSCGAESITFANRTFSKAEQLSEQLQRCAAMTLEDGLNRLHEFDVIIAATSSQEFVLKAEHSEVLRKRRSGLPGVIVDISVPRNVDPSLGKLKNLFVFDVDDLDKVMESSRQARKTAAQAAEQIIREELAEFISQRRQRENLVNVGKFHAWVRTVVQREIIKSLRASSAFDDSQIQITADAVAKKLVAHPAFLARSDVRVENEFDSIGDVLELLFRLSDGEKN